MGISTVIGLLLGIGLLAAGFVLEGGAPAMLVSVTAAVIVFGGMLGATVTAFPLDAILALPKLILISVKGVPDQSRQLVDQFVQMAEKARAEGLLALEQEAETLADPFVRKGMMLVVDGVDPELVQEILEAEIEAMAERHEVGIQMFEAMGGFAPTMGVLGTVMGLVLVLSNLAQPEALGHKIATAFIATLYGVGSANLVLLPIAGKLKAFSKFEQQQRHLAMQGILAVQAGDNPRIVREKLDAYLAPKRRGGAGTTPAESDSGAAIRAA